MRNVAKRLLMGDTAQCVISWKMKVVEMNNEARGKAIMKRVGKRMMNKELSIAFCNWHDNQVEEKNKGRGEQIMRRVGARMMNKELVLAFEQMVHHFKDDIRNYLQTKWDEATEMRQKVAVKLWGYRMDRAWQMIQQKLYNEWVRFVSTKRRSLLRKRLTQRAAAGGARIMVMGIMYARYALGAYYFCIWVGIAVAEKTKQKAKAQVQQLPKTSPTPAPTLLLPLLLLL